MESGSQHSGDGLWSWVRKPLSWIVETSGHLHAHTVGEMAKNVVLKALTPSCVAGVCCPPTATAMVLAVIAGGLASLAAVGISHLIGRAIRGA